MRLLLVKCRSDKSWLVIGVAEAFSLLVADQGGLCVFPFGNNDAGIGVGAYGFVSSTWWSSCLCVGVHIGIVGAFHTLLWAVPTWGPQLRKIR